jgi:hypothetical protein
MCGRPLVAVAGRQSARFSQAVQRVQDVAMAPLRREMRWHPAVGSQCEYVDDA